MTDNNWKANRAAAQHSVQRASGMGLVSLVDSVAAAIDIRVHEAVRDAIAAEQERFLRIVAAQKNTVVGKAIIERLTSGKE